MAKKKRQRRAGLARLQNVNVVAYHFPGALLFT